MSVSVHVNQLVKTYGTKKAPVNAVQGISFAVEKGELFGIIGPDGAGKTSLFRMLTTLLLPDSGSATVDGNDIVRDYKIIRKKVGYMPGRFSLYQDLTVEENLHFFATIFHTSIAENYDLVKDIYSQIEPFKKRMAGKLSGGMKQKLALSCALIHRPVVLFLDEPTTGVDAVSRKEFWEMLKRLREQQITIIVSTPYMDEAMRCDRIGLMQSGKFLSTGTPQEVIGKFTDTLLAVKADNMHLLLHKLKTFEGIKDAYPFGEYHHAVLRNGISIGDLQQFLDPIEYSGLQVQPVAPDIEDCFMQLMKG